jgi:hypothetical protein
MVEQRGEKYGIQPEKDSRAEPTEKFEESPDTSPGEDG